jgi:hypothetical protein
MPQWDMIPAGVVEAVCQRLQRDAIATGPLTIVKTTQALVTAESVAAIAAATPGTPGRPMGGQIVQRTIPLQFAESACSWRQVDSRLSQRSDEMVVELSSPFTNPYLPTEAGLFARVVLGTEHQSWYWVSLVPRGSNQWAVRSVSVLPK